MDQIKLTDEDDGDTLEEEVEPKLSDDYDGDTLEEEPLSSTSLGYKECCEETSKDVSKQWENTFDEAIENELRSKLDVSSDSPTDDEGLTKVQREAKDRINSEIMKLIMYRSERKWFATIAVISIFGALLILMLSFIAMGKDLMPEWKEILLVMLGAFVGSFSRVIDHYFNSSQAEEKLLESAND